MNANAANALGAVKLGTRVLVCVFSVAAWVPAQDADPGVVLPRLRSSNPALRERACEDARHLGEGGLAAIAPLLASERPDVVAAARRAMWSIVHRATAPGRTSARIGCSVVLLTVVLDESLPTLERHEILRMLSVAAHDEKSVEGVAELLADADLAPMALFALTRISHPAAEDALVEALGHIEGARARAVVGALAARRSRSAVPALLELAEGDDAALARASRGALARIGDPRAEARLRLAIARLEPGAVDDWLRFLEARVAAARATLARVGEDYRFLSASSEPAVRAAAIVAMAGVADAATADFALDLLDDPAPRVRAAARDVLTGMGTQVEDRLLADLERRGGHRRGELLRILVARGHPAAPGHLRRAALDPAAPEHLAAVELLARSGEAGAEPVLLWVSQDGSAPARALAAPGLLAAARRHRAAERPRRALALLHRVLQCGGKPRVTRAALGELAEMGDPSSLPHLDAVADDRLAPGLAQVRLAVAERLDGDRRELAVSLCRDVLAHVRSRPLRRRAASRLAALGVDVSSLAARSGFVTTWRVIGPFEECEKDELGTHPFADGGRRLADSYPAGERTVTWRAMSTADPDGVVDLTALTPSTDCVAYAVCDLHSGVERAVTLKIGSDDGVAVWVNGVLVHDNFVWRGVGIDQDEVTARLDPGLNRIIVKITQGGGGWAFCLRVADAEGTPLDLTGPGLRLSSGGGSSDR